MHSFRYVAWPLLVAFCGASAAGEMQTANTMKLSEGEKSPAATIADMAWYAGNWLGTGLGGLNEEAWTEPRGGKMLGMYRMYKDNEPVFYELLVIEEHEGSLIIRLKHFHPDMRGWEEKDASVSFPFVRKDGSRIYFGGMTFERQGEDAVNIYLAIGGKDGKIREEKFTLTRQKK